MHTSRNKGLGFGGGAAGLTVLAGVLLGDVNTSTSNYWCRPPVIAALGIGALLCAFGVWTLGVTYRGWWQPQTHEERVAQREAHELAQTIDRLNLGHALDEIAEELENSFRGLRGEVETGRTRGGGYRNDAWSKNRPALSRGELAATRDLVDDAYLRLDTLGQQTAARFDAASHEQVNDPDWQKLSAEELQERTEARDVVAKA